MDYFEIPIQCEGREDLFFRLDNIFFPLECLFEFYPKSCGLTYIDQNGHIHFAERVDDKLKLNANYNNYKIIYSDGKIKYILFALYIYNYLFYFNL